jgi:hypothetical protein
VSSKLSDWARRWCNSVTFADPPSHDMENQGTPHSVAPSPVYSKPDGILNVVPLFCTAHTDSVEALLPGHPRSTDVVTSSSLASIADVYPCREREVV